MNFYSEFNEINEQTGVIRYGFVFLSGLFQLFVTGEEGLKMILCLLFLYACLSFFKLPLYHIPIPCISILPDIFLIPTRAGLLHLLIIYQYTVYRMLIYLLFRCRYLNIFSLFLKVDIVHSCKML